MTWPPAPALSSPRFVFSFVIACSFVAACGSLSPRVRAADPLPQVPELETYSPTEVRNLVRLRLREEVGTRNSETHPRSILQLVDLHAAIRLDERYDESRLLQGAATTARRRLISVQRDLQRQLLRKNIARPKDLDAWIESYIDQRKQGEQASDDRDAAGQHDATEVDRYGSDEDEGSSSDSSTETGGHAPAGVPDYGWELAELIRRTIVPSYWSTRGGPGVIQYDAMRMALVIRARSHIHEQVGGFLR